MCIFQDALGDWHAQAAKMRQIYAFASCNIAATSAKDGNDGLNFERFPLMVPPGLAHLAYPLEVGNILIDKAYLCAEFHDLVNEVLNTRGWVRSSMSSVFSTFTD